VIEVSPAAAAQLNVTGTASIAGGLTLVFDPGTYSNKSYTLVHSGALSGGYSGTNFTQNDGASGDIQTIRGMVYAHYRAAPQILVDGIAGIAYDRIHTSRPITALSSTVSGNRQTTSLPRALSCHGRASPSSRGSALSICIWPRTASARAAAQASTLLGKATHRESGVVIFSRASDTKASLKA
jgi:hypothetical protein